MKHIFSLVDMSKVKEARMSENTEVINEETAKIVNLLFKELQAIFPAFKQAWPDQEAFNCAKKNWIKALMATNIHSGEQLRHGLQKCRLSTSPFAPSVGQFIQWCLPEPQDLGLPNVDEAYALSISINRQFSDYKPTCQKTFAAIRHTIEKIGSMNYRSMPAEASRKAFERFYSESCTKVINDGFAALTEAPVAKLELDDKQKRQDSSIQARLDAIEAIRKVGIPVAIRDWDEKENEKNSQSGR